MVVPYSNILTFAHAVQMPLCTMEGHSNAVSAVCWPDVLAIYTGSHDHSIKHWDPEATQCVRTWVCAIPFPSLMMHAPSSLFLTCLHSTLALFAGSTRVYSHPACQASHH